MENFTISGIIGDSFSSLKGIKGKVWLNVFFMLIITALLNLFAYSILSIDIVYPPFYFAYIVMPIVTNFFIAPFYAAAVMVCVSHLRKESMSIKKCFSYFFQYFSLGLALAIIGLLASLFIIIINIPAIINYIGQHKIWLDLVAGLYSLFIYTFFILTIPLIADKKLRPLPALKESCRYISQHWIRTLIIIMITYLIILLCTIPLLIGLLLAHRYIVLLGGIIIIVLFIWVVPFLFMIQGMIYHRLVD